MIHTDRAERCDTLIFAVVVLYIHFDAHGRSPMNDAEAQARYRSDQSQVILHLQLVARLIPHWFASPNACCVLLHAVDCNSEEDLSIDTEAFEFLDLW